VPAAILLFARGIAGIHHAHRAQRLADEVGSSEEARKILDKVDTLESEKARALVELLASDYAS